MKQKIAKDALKVLLIDIETAPNLGWTWGKYEQNVIKFEQESYMLCFTAKWLDSDKIITVGLDDFKGYNPLVPSDKELCQKLWDILDAADVVIGHNADKFDIKKINTRFLVNKINPPSPYRTIDTLKLAKKYFSFNSNKLDDLGQTLQLGRKLDTGGFDLWLGCMKGDKKAWDKMKKYNKQDVLLLEKVYMEMRPWMNPHPNIAINISKTACDVCGNDKLQRRGFSYTRQTKYQRLHCTKCGSWKQGPIEKDG